MKNLIKEGDRSQEVADVQARLREVGLDVDDEPGSFGASTKEAVRAFQQRRDLLADGIVGPDSWNALVEAGWRFGDRALYFKNPPMRGDDVLALQARMNALGFDSGREDGIFGRDTDNAVRAFQHEYAIPEDGIFGPRSVTALRGLRADRAHTAAGLREELRRMEGKGIRGTLIVIDPGHGGEDRGDREPGGHSEADLCWDLANRLATSIAAAGARVRFTRTETEGPEPSERARRANELNGDIFLSLHLNSHSEPIAEGASTYYFPRSRAGEVLAEVVKDRLVHLGLRDCRSHARSYSILRETRMPAVLVEPAFISNPDEAKLLLDPDFRSTIAGAIASGVRQYFEELAP
ncbi:MAG TPA: N-acetylmuramoyl-L-alanine amidase [Actinomycetota bacterium]|nr:N-acetylmuramoyl-L-alanine amidase [Actinomycetota bacterium]